MSVAWSYGFVLRHCFGITRQAADIYYKDTSGPGKHPIPGSKIEPQNRIYYRTHQMLLQGLLGQGFSPKMDRFEEELETSVSSLPVSEEWVEFPDLMEFYQLILGCIVIKTVFGKALLSCNPDFIRMLWDFDSVVTGLAKRFPIICAPKKYWLRRKLIQCVKNWHRYATIHSTESESAEGRDVDPLWGSRMIRERYSMLHNIKSQDPDSIASTDLAFIWS